MTENADRPDQLAHAIHLAMRNRHALADAGRSQRFAIEKNPDDFRDILLLDRPALHQKAHELANDTVLSIGLQITTDRSFNQKLHDLHDSSSVPNIVKNERVMGFEPTTFTLAT